MRVRKQDRAEFPGKEFSPMMSCPVGRWQLFLILCLRLYADNSDSLFEALADGFTS